jgi:hypothetical protein
MGLFSIRSVAAACVLVLAGSPLYAQQPADIEALRAEVAKLRQALDDVEAKLAAVQGAPAPQPAAPQTPAPTMPVEAAVPAGAAGAGGPSGSLPVYGGAVAASKVFNPDMAVIGNFIGAAGKNDVAPLPALEMHEAEATFQAVVDPYARADFFLGFGEEGVDLEEGYVTFPTVPGGLLVRAGKIKAAFGKVNASHSHILPWVDRPLVTDNLLNGEEGISDAGFSVARLIPNRLLFLEATGQVFRGDSGDVFRSRERGDLSYVAHLRAYHDVTENSNVDFGGSFAYGHNSSGDLGNVSLGNFATKLYGVDATYRWRPLARSIYRSFVGRTEVVWSRRDEPIGLASSMGYFVSGDYQFQRRWFVGGRFDRSGRADAGSTIDWGQSASLTYWPSEFSQVRGQYRRTKYAEASTANEFLFQLQFSIGAHGAHPF